MKRRKFIHIVGIGAISVLSYKNLMGFTNTDTVKNKEVFQSIINKAEKENWKNSEIGDLIVKIGMKFLGTPYVAGTLEGDPEITRVDLTGMDCVTFYEYSLCLARIIKLGKNDYQDLVNELTFVRYRDGVQGDYSTRLHYTSDWIDNNVKKYVIKDVTNEIGGEIYDLHVGFMSEHPQYYSALKNDPEMVKKIAKIEEEINSRTHYYIPKRKVKNIDKFLQKGDIIAIATSIEGLDYAHTGLINIDESQNVRFFHASSKKKKVVLDGRLYQYMSEIKKDIGITVARPIFTL